MKILTARGCGVYNMSVTFLEFDAAIRTLIREAVLNHNDQPDPLQVDALAAAIERLVPNYVREVLVAVDPGMQEILTNLVKNSGGKPDLEVDAAATNIEERVLFAFEAAQK